ncbi:MAG: enoyl-CoA hydratase/isomerase family protein [Deltaproteobacteria bacterium]|nr:enoyl-CoA hydratase/isomerase family protein [Deltaproteobacteria bacterium]
MEFETIIYEKKENVARIVLNQPDVMNAIGWSMMYEIDAALTRAEKDDDIKVVVLRGIGRAFSAGYDLRDKTVAGGDIVYRRAEAKPGEEPPGQASQRIRLRLDKEWNDIIKHLFLCSKTTIAQLHGYCLGHALMMVEKCDLIIGSEECKLGYVEERLTFGGMSMSPMLMLRVGWTKALELMITGKMISGKEAADINLINRAVPEDKLEKEVDDLARAICLYPRDGLALGKTARHTVYETMGMNQWFSIGAYLPHVLLLYMGSGSEGDSLLKDLNEKGMTAAIHERQDKLKELGLLDALDK